MVGPSPSLWGPMISMYGSPAILIEDKGSLFPSLLYGGREVTRDGSIFCDNIIYDRSLHYHYLAFLALMNGYPHIS